MSLEEFQSVCYVDFKEYLILQHGSGVKDFLVFEIIFYNETQNILAITVTIF
jgi:hypothetical protein